MIQIGNENIGTFPLLLAPMEDVSDPPFRALCKEHGADLMYTEFISTDGLVRNAEKSIQKLDIYDYERPIGIQIFGSDFEAMKYSAIIVERHKPTLLDINYIKLLIFLSNKSILQTALRSLLLISQRLLM